jgi:hypothetical protein
MSETSNGQAGRGFGAAHGYAYFVDSEIGMTMGDTTVKQLPDGTWKATAPIGTLFGSEVDGECRGTGATKEAALEALKQDRKNLNDSLWA